MIGRWIDNWFSSFERGSYRFEVEESIGNGDRVYMALRHTARGEADSVDVTLRTYHAFTVAGIGLGLPASAWFRRRVAAPRGAR